MTAPYPSTLPPPLITGYGIEFDDPFIRTDVEQGLPRQRQRSSTIFEKHSFRTVLGKAEYAVFKQWWFDNNFGVSWFSIPLQGDEDVETKTARFAETPKVAFEEGIYSVSMVLEVRD